MTTVARMEVGMAVFSLHGFEKRSHAAKHVISFPFFQKKYKQFNWTPQTPEMVFLLKDKKPSHMHADSEFRGKMPF